MSEINSLAFKGNASNNLKSEEGKKTKYTKATLAAMGATSAIGVVQDSISSKALKEMTKDSLSLSKDQIKTVNDVADKMVTSFGLDKKGVKIVDLRNSGINLIGMPDAVLEKVNPMVSTANGKNAFFAPKGIPGIVEKNSVVINREKLSLAAFHEIGHADNFNNSKVMKGLQKMRMPGMAVAGGLALLAVFGKKLQPVEGQEQSKASKIKDKVRDNAGVLSFLALTPMLIEEGVASIKGCKFANKNMPAELAKKVAKTNKIAYVSYLAGAVGAGLVACVGRHVKDNFVEKKNEQKLS